MRTVLQTVLVAFVSGAILGGADLAESQDFDLGKARSSDAAEGNRVGEATSDGEDALKNTKKVLTRKAKDDWGYHPVHHAVHYNPWTGGYHHVAVHHNPWTGRYHHYSSHHYGYLNQLDASEKTEDDWGYHPTHHAVHYNPWTGGYHHVAVHHNPWTGRYHHYSSHHYGYLNQLDASEKAEDDWGYHPPHHAVHYNPWTGAHHHVSYHHNPWTGGYHHTVVHHNPWTGGYHHYSSHHGGYWR